MSSAWLRCSADSVCIDKVQGRSDDQWSVQGVRWLIKRLIDVVQMWVSNQQSSDKNNISTNKRD